MIKIKYEKLTSRAITPQKGTKKSQGFDLFAPIWETIYPGQTLVIPTGIRVEVPENHFMYISSKGGPAAKHNIFVLNSPGLLDEDYRGEILVILHMALNGDEDQKSYMIQTGEKIAQFVILPYPEVELEEGVVSKDTERGEGCLGSTGIFKGVD